MKKLTFLILFLLIFSGCGQEELSSNKTNTMPNNTAKQTNFTCDQKSYQTTCPQKGDKIAIIKTNLGVIKFKLFPNDVSETAHNFEVLANEGKYDGSIFHRIMKDFMIQGGDFEKGNGTGGYSYKGPGTTIKEEFSPKLTHIPFAVSMAKTRLPATTGSQFFIVQAKDGAHWLDNQHSVFGQVYFGADIVDKIANLKVDNDNYPQEKIVTSKVLVTEFGSEEDSKY